MTRDHDRAEIAALKAALNTALDLVDAERTKATRETARAERAISVLRRIPARQTPSLITHALAFAAGGLATSFVIWVVGVSL